VEAEYALGHTRIAGEFVATAFDTAPGRRRATAWTVDASQSLAPRWFVAGRLRMIQAPWRDPALAWSDSSSAEPPWGAPVGGRGTSAAAELTLGHRLSPELTLRAGLIGRRPFGTHEWRRSAGASLVWAHRWF
jgi:hypothetical protein